MNRAVTVISWPLIVLAYLTLFGLGLLDNARGPYFQDIIQDLSLSDTQAAVLFGMASGMGFVCGYFVPRWVRRFRLVPVVRAGQLIMGIGFASIALAESLATLALTAALFGVGFGILNVAQNLLILEGAKGPLRRRLLSGLHGMYAAASLISPVIAAFLFKMGFTWRQAFVGFSSVVLVSLFSSFFVKRKMAASLDDEVSRVRPAIVIAATGRPLVLASMISFYVLGELVISTRLSLYLRRIFAYSPEDAAMVLGAFFAFLLLGRMLILSVPVRLSSLRIIELGLMSSFVVYAMGLWVHPSLLALCGLTMAPIFAVSLDFVAELFPDNAVETLSYCLAVSCLYIVSMHFLMGVLTDIFGIRLSMHVGLIALFIAWILLRRVKTAPSA